MLRTILPFVILFVSLSSKAQENTRLTSSPEEFRSLLQKKIRVTREMAEKNVSYFFTIKFEISDSLNIELSKYAPKEIIPLVSDPQLYKNVDWEKVLGRKKRPIEVLIVPIYIYNDQRVNEAIFYEYTLEDIFAYPKSKPIMIECNIFKTVNSIYGSPIH